MKSVFVWIVLLVHVAVADAAMSRVVRVDDSRTIVVDTKGVIVAVQLRDVAVPRAEEKDAVEFLRRTVMDRWVYIERGDVYRSPDGLDVTRAMRTRAWYGSTFLGILDGGFKNERAKVVEKPEKQKPPAAKRSSASKGRRSGARASSPAVIGRPRPITD